MANQSAAEKLYNIITADQGLGKDRIKKLWNLENRVYSVNRFLNLIGTIKDTNPTHNTDLETLAKCAEKLEEKASSKHWQKTYANKNRRLKKKHVEDTIATLKSYIGTEARKKGMIYNKYTNTIEPEYIEPEPQEYSIPLSHPTLEKLVAYA